MARHANLDWSLPENNGTPRRHQWESIHAALLMDIRDELQRLNTLLQCRNFTGIPATLRKIARNTTKKQRTNGKRPA